MKVAALGGGVSTASWGLQMERGEVRARQELGGLRALPFTMAESGHVVMLGRNGKTDCGGGV